MVIFSRSGHVWIRKPISPFRLRTTFSHFSHQLWNLKRDSKLYINHILEYIHQYTSVLAVFYTCLSFGIKNSIPCQESLFTQSRSLNGILYDAKINKSSFDVKQSVLSIGSQYTLVWQTLCQKWRKS